MCCCSLSIRIVPPLGTRWQVRLGASRRYKLENSKLVRIILPHYRMRGFSIDPSAIMELATAVFAIDSRDSSKNAGYPCVITSVLVS